MLKTLLILIFIFCLTLNIESKKDKSKPNIDAVLKRDRKYKPRSKKDLKKTFEKFKNGLKHGNERESRTAIFNLPKNDSIFEIGHEIIYQSFIDIINTIHVVDEVTVQKHLAEELYYHILYIYINT